MASSWHPTPLSLSGLTISPVMSGELERQAKRSGSGQVETSMNNLKWTQCSFERILPVKSSSFTQSLSVYSSADWQRKLASCTVPLEISSRSLAAPQRVWGWWFCIPAPCCSAGWLSLYKVRVHCSSAYLSNKDVELGDKLRRADSLYHKLLSLFCQISKCSQREGHKVGSIK